MAKNKQQTFIPLQKKYKIQKEPWKVWMSPSPESSCITLQSLYDLIFYEDEDGYPHFRADALKGDDPQFHGTKLGHDIVIYREDLYTPLGTISQDISFDVWAIYGLDMQFPTYDARSNPYRMTLKPGEKDSPATAKAFERFTEKYGSTFFVFDDNAALPYTDIGAMYKGPVFSLGNNRKGINWRQGSVPSIDSQNGAFDSTGFNRPEYAFTVGSQDRSQSYNSDIILMDQDKVFRTSMVFERAKSPWTSIAVNGRTERVCKFISSILANYSCGSKIVTSNDLNISYIKASVLDAADESISFEDLIKNDSFRQYLKTIKIYVRAAAAADYVRPKDFNQDLNQDADVIHKNVYASRTGDFNRYDTEISIEAEERLALAGDRTQLSADSLPYIPKSAPLKDFVSNKFYSKKDTVKDTMDDLITKSSHPLSEVGSVLSEPAWMAGMTQMHAENLGSSKITDMVTPLTYFDPESRYTADNYSRVPTIIPKNGNLFADERVISPTIDELWYIIKKMISGRQADTGVETLNNDYDPDFARSKGTENYENEKSTVLSEVKDSEFTWKEGSEDNIKSHVGDPVDFEYVFDDPMEDSSGVLTALDRIKEVKVKEFFTQPTQNNYVIYSDTIIDENKITEFKKVTDAEYTPLNKVDISGVVTKTHVSDPTSKWAPRVDPLTLRELEARTLGNKHSIVTNFRYITTNFVTVGQLGKTDEETGIGGTLYQLHTDYNYKPDAPNTFYKLHGDETSENGADVVYSDYDALTPEEKALEDNFKSTGKQPATDSHLVKYVAHYGKSSVFTENQEEFHSSEVYLSAEGKWRYLREHTRIPVLRSRY